MSIGNGQPDSSVKFAQYLAAARAGKLLSQAEYSVPISLVTHAHVGSISPRHTRSYAVSTNTSVTCGSLHQSAALTNTLVIGPLDTTSAAHPSFGAPAISPIGNTNWWQSVGQITHFANYLPAIMWIDSVYSGSGGSFGQVDYAREQRSKMEIDQATAVLPHDLGQKMRTRLLFLSDIAAEEGLESAGPAPDSVHAAVAFLASLSASRALREFSLTLDSSGLVLMEWRKGHNESAVLRFFSDGLIGAALTTPISGRLDRPNTWLAIVTTENLLDSILANGSWKTIIFHEDALRL